MLSSNSSKISLKTYGKRIIADTVTPLGMYLRLRDKYPNNFLLESTDSHAQENCMTYICINPIAGFKAVGKQVQESYPDSSAKAFEVESRSEVLDQFKEFVDGFNLEPQDPIASKVLNGFFGYFAFGAVQYFEDIELKSETGQERKVPDLWYQIFKYVIAVNHFRHEAQLIVNTDLNAHEAALELEELENNLRSRSGSTGNFSLVGDELSNLTDDQHAKMIEDCKQHIFRGDIFQIVPSRRFSQAFSGDDMAVYRVLRSINPSPYLFYFDFGDFKLFGSSPEAQLITQDGKASIFPIAGTYRRTGNDLLDAQEVERLKADPKENAEHVMLVDLARNDLSRFCHNVHVAAFKSIKYFSHVIHLESEVVGNLEDGVAAIDVLAATHPAGTLSGAPKYRAMQLIDQYEPDGRGIYGGAIGVIGIDGRMSNHAIMIRSFLSKNKQLFFQAGGGVVADSVTESEVQEVRNKLGALRQALNQAEQLADGSAL